MFRASWRTNEPHPRPQVETLGTNYGDLVDVTVKPGDDGGDGLMFITDAEVSDACCCSMPAQWVVAPCFTVGSR